MEEVWKPVVGYEGLYEVSSLGRVRSLDRVVMRGGKPLRMRGSVKRPAVDSYGYSQARMTKGGVGKLVLVHRMVAIAFIDNTDNLPEVNHRDLDKSNNCIKNLQWVSHDDNMSHAGRRGRMCGYMNPNKRAKLTPEKVADIRESVAGGESERSAGRRHGVSGKHAGNVVRGERWNPSVLETAPTLLRQDLLCA